MHTSIQRRVASAFDEDDRHHAENRRLKQLATRRRGFPVPTHTRKQTDNRQTA
jgi:hypothetical protein